MFEYGKDGPRLLVVGLDGSRTSWRAAAYAAGLARRNHARLIVVHVTGANLAMAGLTPQAAALDLTAEDEWSQELRGELSAALERGDWDGLEVLFQRRSGDPAHEIGAVADENHADGVVVGTSEAPGHRLIGSTAVRLVRAGRWPVTVVP
jgi:nucleotide-binding universal stress UspA family protein